MANTPNKDLEEPVHGSEVDTWDQPLNDNFTKMDLAFGGSTTLNAAGASGNVAFTVAQATPPTIIVSGLPVGNVNYRLASGIGGCWSVSNVTTGGFTITFESLGGGSAVEIPAGVNTLISCDGTSRGMVYSSEADPPDFILVEEQTPGGTLPYVAFTDLTTGDYQIRFRNLRAAIDQTFGLQFSTTNGASWISTAGDYNFVETTNTVDKTSATGQTTGAVTTFESPSGTSTYMHLGGAFGSVTVTAGTAGLSGVIDINILSGVPSTAHFVGEADTLLSGTYQWQKYEMSGNTRNNNTLKNAVRIVSNAASNITATKVSLYRYIA